MRGVAGGYPNPPRWRRVAPASAPTPAWGRPHSSGRRTGPPFSWDDDIAPAATAGQGEGVAKAEGDVDAEAEAEGMDDARGLYFDDAWLDEVDVERVPEWESEEGYEAGEEEDGAYNEAHLAQIQEALGGDGVEVQAHAEGEVEVGFLPEQGVVEVDDALGAAQLVTMLMSDACRGAWHALAVEGVGVEVGRGPVGNGRVSSLSIYCGPGFDFGEGHPKVFVDCTAPGVLATLEPYLTSRHVRNVWHHYGVQRHLMSNTGVRPRSLGGDTLHMARLWDPTRGDEGYALEDLCDAVLDEDGVVAALGAVYARPSGPDFPRTDGDEAAREELLRRPQAVRWVTSQAVLTWHLRHALERKLRRMEWVIEGGGGAYRSQYLGTMWDFYNAVWKPFGEVLTDVEDRGMHVDTAFLRRQEEIAQAEANEARHAFVEWAAEHVSEDVRVMNLQSSVQLGHLLFGEPLRFDEYGEVVLGQPGNVFPKGVRSFERRMTDEEYMAEQGKREAWAEAETVRRRMEWEAVVEEARRDDVAAGRPPRPPGHRTLPKEPGRVRPKRVSRTVEFALAGMGLPMLQKTPSGRPKVDQAVIEALAGSPEEPGAAAAIIGEDGCEALRNLGQALLVEKTLQTFLKPLQMWPQTDRDDLRVHTMLNIGTETGRLSSRRPNLQNQPSMERDPYRVREAFSAPEGHSFIVADYGQLELRLLAHMSGCGSMIDAFKAGGDFHSRTALGMYEHVRRAVESGEVVVEEDPADRSEERKPLLKDVFPVERRNAKTLNFGIAYGQTHYGLAKEWGVTPAEARATVNHWYRLRPEVKDWQDRVAHRAQRTGYTHSLLGRPRPLKELMESESGAVSARERDHALRVAINTPVQGGAADVVTCAMLRMANSPILRSLGFRMVLQIHDELIFEGPTAFADEAVAEIVRCMANPFPTTFPALLVALEVDAVIAPTWFHAKGGGGVVPIRLSAAPRASFDASIS